MDFFAAEDRARRRTRRLMGLFVLAVALMIASGYLAAVLALNASAARVRIQTGNGDWDPDYAAQPSLWHPTLLLGVASATLAVVGGASLFKWLEMRDGGPAVAEGMGARRLSPQTADPAERQLLNVVEEMSIASGVPVPAVFILEEESGINAFAAGHGPGDAALTVTHGALRKLTRDELQGVVGHEFSHILNGDMRMNMRLTAILFGILVIGLAGRGLLMSLRFGLGGGSRREGRGAGALALGAGLVLLLIGYTGYWIGRLVQAAVSRQREFLADASAIQFTRNPQGLSGALRKIGGNALGSSLDARRAVQYGHFFFAQASLSSFGGLWATHPPLVVRIRAIDPSFDGTFLEPPTVVDVAHQPWSAVRAEQGPITADPSAAATPAARPPSAPSSAAPMRPPAGLAPLQPPVLPTSFVATAGTVPAEAVLGAQSFLAGLPLRLREAARSTHDAPELLYGLLLDDNPAIRARQVAMVAAQAGGQALHTLEELAPALAQIGEVDRLPLLQLAIPALRSLPAATLPAFAGLLDDLAAAHGEITPFDYALQKLVLKALAAGRAGPAPSGVQITSFVSVAGPISVVLSCLARASSPNPTEVARAFGQGAATLKLLEGRLTLVAAGACGLDALDEALDALAAASGPIKQRLLTSAAHVILADGVLLPPEVELLRAVAAVLDVPMPRLDSTAA